MGSFKDIKTALVRLFKHNYPQFDVFCEDIINTAAKPEEQSAEDWIHISITPAGNETVNEFHTDRRILIDVSIHTAGESNEEYLQIAQEADDMLRPVFRFGARAATIQEIEFKTVDKVLHAIFPIVFRDTKAQPEQPPMMKTLETTTNYEGR